MAKLFFLSGFFSGKTVFFSDFFSGKTCFFSYFFIGYNPSNLYMFGIKSKWKGFTLIYTYIYIYIYIYVVFHILQKSDVFNHYTSKVLFQLILPRFATLKGMQLHVGKARPFQESLEFVGVSRLMRRVGINIFQLDSSCTVGRAFMLATHAMVCFQRRPFWCAAWRKWGNIWYKNLQHDDHNMHIRFQFDESDDATSWCCSEGRTSNFPWFRSSLEHSA